MNKLLPMLAGVILAITGFAASASEPESSPELNLKENSTEQARKHKHKHHKHRNHRRHHHDDDYYHDRHHHKRHKRGHHIVVH